MSLQLHVRHVGRTINLTDDVNPLFRRTKGPKAVQAYHVASHDQS